MPPSGESAAGDVVRAPPSARVKPLLRGWSHLIAFFLVLVAGGVLLVRTGGEPGRDACLIYVATLALLFGVSALYHRPNWSPGLRPWLQRLDHSAIFLLVAGTYTGVGRALPADTRRLFLEVAWSGAAAGCAVALFWPQAPKAVSAAAYLVLGWTALWFLPTMDRTMGFHVVGWIVGGGALYTLGAMAYALRWPDPWPRVFGYHEIFHAFVIGAAACHFVGVALVLLQGTAARSF
ncbi:MAG: PAQR family membrane homeostasis protein TrhA [Myxococcales bacterium]